MSVSDKEQNTKENKETMGEQESTELSDVSSAEESVTEAGAIAEDWKAEADKFRDDYLRAVAELDNTRKRSERQVADAHKFAVERFAKELLAVRDSLEMALVAPADDAAAIDKLREGVEMTLKVLDGVFDKFGIQIVHPENESFDPNRHQAIATVEHEGEANKVIEVHQKGFVLNERLLRPALVSVSKVAGK